MGFAEDVQFKSLLESCLELDPTDGRCAMVEEHGSDSPSRILKWCKDVAVQVEALSLEVSRLPMNVHMATASNVPVGGRIMISFWCVQRDIQVRVQAHLTLDFAGENLLAVWRRRSLLAASS